MLALSELERIALISGGVSLLVAVLAFVGVVYQSRKTRGELSTGGLGRSIGAAVARLEEMLWRHEHRLDALDVRLRENTDTTVAAATAVEEQIEPVAAWVEDQKNGGSE